MANDPQAKVTISADDSPLRASLRDMVGKMRDFGDDAGKGVERVNGPLEALKDRFLAFTAILGGGALFGRAVQETAQLTEDALQLGKAMDVSASEARVWMAALDDVGASTGELSSASRGLLKNVRENEQALKDMGLATRDANGNLRPMTELMTEAIALANDFADGTDRQVAVQQLFGKGLDASSKLLNLTADTVRDTKAAFQELGVVVGEDDVAAFQAYDSATDRMQLTLQALTTTIGNSLMPVLTKLATWFNDIGPAAVVVVRGAIGGLASAFWGLKNGVTIVWETINAMVVTVTEPLRSLASGLYKLVTGDFKGAAEEMLNWPDRIGEAWGKAWDEMVKSSVESRDRMAELFFDGPEAESKGGGGSRRAKVPPKNEGEKQGAGSYMQYYETMLTEEKRVQATLDAGRDYSKAQELEFWRFLSGNLQMTSADRIAVLRKMSQLELDIARQGRKDREAIDQADLESATKLALGRVDAQAQAARTAVDLGQLTKQQLAQLEVQFEDERYRIQSAALQERLRLLALDPNSSPVEMARLKNELLLLEQDYQTRRTQLVGQATVQKGSLGDALTEQFGGEGSWQTMLDGMLQRAQTWQEAMGSIFAQTGRIFVQKLVTEPAAAWLASMAKMLLVKLGFLTQEKAMDATASAAKVGIKAAETTAVVSANAAQAGTGAAASQAGIPVVGPALALAAMAAVFAAVMALGGSRKSARGGYDIPSGVNPVTQLHEEEMVLPSPLANAVRRMAEGGGDAASSAAAGPAVELRGFSAEEFFIAKRADLLKVLGGARRDFAWR